MNVELPELPKTPNIMGQLAVPDVFTASQMQEYAKQAVLADRAAFNLSKYIIAANIRASDMPHVVVEKLAAAIRQEGQDK